MSKENAGSVEFLHEIVQRSVSGGKRVVNEEFIIKGSKGLTIKHFHAEGTNKVRTKITTNDDGTFNYMVTAGDDKKPNEVLSKADLLKKLEKDKLLKFAVDFLKAMKGGRYPVKLAGGAWAARARAMSKKGSRKGSKRGSSRRRRSAKRSRRSSKKGSKKASRRRSSRKMSGGKRRRSSKKGSKKASRRRSSRKMSGGKRRRSSKKGSKKASRRRRSSRKH